VTKAIGLFGINEHHRRIHGSWKSYRICELFQLPPCSSAGSQSRPLLSRLTRTTHCLLRVSLGDGLFIAFALHKLWVSKQDAREAIKRRRDATQAAAVAEVAQLIGLKFDKKELAALP
jgi:Nucleotidyltransferase